jgi:hypothetical protein
MEIIMKFFATFLILLSSFNIFASTNEVYECLPSGSNVLYEDTFQVVINRNGMSKLLYKREINFRGKIIQTAYEPVRGCFQASFLKQSSPNFDLQIICENEGEDGAVSINSNSLVGEIYFYMPQIGYPERTLLEINCHRLN